LKKQDEKGPFTQGEGTDNDVIFSYYSSLIRLYISSYTTLFTVFLGYFVYFYAVFSNKTLINQNQNVKALFIFTDVGLLLMCLLMLWRYKMFSKALIRMEKDVQFSNGKTLRQMAIGRWIYPRRESSSLTRFYYWAIEKGRDEERCLTIVEFLGLFAVLCFFVVNLCLVLL